MFSAPGWRSRPLQHKVEAMRILMAMSGGVDSSVAAALLHEEGHQVVGVTLHLWDASGASKVGRCCAPEDRDDARASCDVLGIPHYVIDERTAFREHVVDPFVRGYAAGVTPSPCVTCNQHVKLGRLAELADAFGCERIATGHYARIEHETSSGAARLYRGRDAQKDQSYFLYGVPGPILSRMMFPLGGMTKSEVREHGRRLGVPNWNKPDSQELCFVPDGDIAGFVEGRGARGKSGRIVDVEGQVLAPHEGVHRFTVGQRKGLGLSQAPADGRPRYVLRIVNETGDVVVGSDGGLGANELVVEEGAWIRAMPDEFTARVQIRHHHAGAEARVDRLERGFRVRFSSPQRAVAPGQAAVVYLGDEVIAGGPIAKVHDHPSEVAT